MYVHERDKRPFTERIESLQSLGGYESFHPVRAIAVFFFDRGLKNKFSGVRHIASSVATLLRGALVVLCTAVAFALAMG